MMAVDDDDGAAVKRVSSNTTNSSYFHRISDFRNHFVSGMSIYIIRAINKERVLKKGLRNENKEKK